MRLKVGTWNVNGIRARDTQLQEWIAVERPDVLCLQETKAPREKIPLWLLELPGYWCLWHGDTAYSGVALNLSREAFPEPPVYSHPEFDHENRIAVAESGGRLFVSTYVPNGGKDYDAKVRFLTALAGFAEGVRAAGKELVICGDLNVALTDQDVHPKERKPGIIGQRPEERALLSQVIGHGLVDVGRAADPFNAGLFTWWAPWRNMRQRNIGWRLDYVLASESLARSVVECRVRAEVGTSDHAPVVAVFEAGASPPADGAGAP